MKKGLLILLCIIMMLSMVLMGCAGKEETDTTKSSETKKTDTTKTDTKEEEPSDMDVSETIEYSYLICWNGGGAGFPTEATGGAIYDLFVEKTGVILNVETIVTSEKEKLATIFVSGDVPDIVNAPYWNTNPGGEGELIKNAAVEGLILALNGLYEDFPNVKRAMEVGMSATYQSMHVEHPEFNGERYVLPHQTPRTNDDVRNWAYNLFARGDIMEDLGIAPDSITTQDDVYNLMKSIKDGGYVDVNEKPVIVGGTMHNGWSYNEFTRGFQVGGVTGWDMVDGTPVAETMNDLTIEKLQFMQKLVLEGLMDPECFSQTNTQGKEKMVTGRVALFGMHYPAQYDFLKTTLLPDNPEMEYVTLGPILNSKGGVVSQNERPGRNGSPVFFFSAEIESPERALMYFDFCYSDDGILLGSKGIEGTHFEYNADGIPVTTDEWKDIQASDPNGYNEEGFSYLTGVGADPRIGWGWDLNYSEAGYVRAREVNPLNFFDGKTFDDISNEWPGKSDYDTKMSLADWGQLQKQAILSDTPEEVVAIVEAQRQRMIDAGYEEMVDYIKQRYEEDSSLQY